MDIHVPVAFANLTKAQQLAELDALLDRIDDRLKVEHERMDKLLRSMRTSAPASD